RHVPEQSLANAEEARGLLRREQERRLTLVGDMLHDHGYLLFMRRLLSVNASGSFAATPAAPCTPQRGGRAGGWWSPGQCRWPYLVAVLDKGVQSMRWGLHGVSPDRSKRSPGSQVLRCGHQQG